MTEFIARLQFVSPCLGNAKEPGSGRFLFSRNREGKIVFLPAWHRSNMVMAANLISDYREEVRRILWGMVVEVELRDKRWHRIYYTNAAGRERYSVHESIAAGQLAEISLSLPENLPVDAFSRLLGVAGKHKGLSPWQPGTYGHYRVVDVFARPTLFTDSE